MVNVDEKLAFVCVCVFHLIGIGIECLARKHTYTRENEPVYIHPFAFIQPTQAIHQLDTLQIFHNLFVLIIVWVCYFGWLFFFQYFFSVVGIVVVTASSTAAAAAAAASAIDPIANSVQSKRNVYNVCHRLMLRIKWKKICGIFISSFSCYRIPGELNGGTETTRGKCVRAKKCAVETIKIYYLLYKHTMPWTCFMSFVWRCEKCAPEPEKGTEISGRLVSYHTFLKLFLHLHMTKKKTFFMTHRDIFSPFSFWF